MQALPRHKSSYALFAAVVVAAAILGSALTATATGDPGTRSTGELPGYDSQRSALAHAREIRAEVDARYRSRQGPRLAITEASETAVIDSFTLLASPVEMPRVVPADNGIYFAICPVRATCPYPGRRFSRSPTAFMPRRGAVELAVRTFLETSANLVVVSLPTARFVLLVLERDDVMGEVDADALHNALARDPTSAPDAWLRRIVDRMTLPRLFLAWALVPISETRETLFASCLFCNV
jgi:hypothetical protein